MNEILLSCPFCGFKPDVNDPDCIYPTSYVLEEENIFQLVCYETGGGCGTSVLGDSVEHVIEKWNTRV